MIIIIINSIVIDSVTPGCSLPSVLRGSWVMTRFGLTTLNVTDTQILGYPVDNTTCSSRCEPAYDFYCDSNSGTQYILK